MAIILTSLPFGAYILEVALLNAAGERLESTACRFTVGTPTIRSPRAPVLLSLRSIPVFQKLE